VRARLTELAESYHHLEAEHRRAGKRGGTRRRLRAKLLRVGRRFEHELAGWVPDEADRDAWRAHVYHGGPLPAAPAGMERPLGFRGRSAAGSVLELRLRDDGDYDAVVDGAEVERLAARDDLAGTTPGLAFSLGGVAFREEFAAGRAARAALARFVADTASGAPWRYAGELVADGLVDDHLGVTPRGRRALATVPAGEEHAGPAVDVATQGAVGDDAVREAVAAIDAVAEVASRPVLHARVALAQEADPARERPAIAKASLDVSGRIVRAHVAAPTMPEAIGELRRRLRRTLAEQTEETEGRRRATGHAAPGEWRHGDLPTARPDYFPRPPDERRVVRQKSVAAGATSPEEAVEDMRLLDHDFFLFENVLTGEDNVVYARGDGTFGLAQPRPDLDARFALPIEVDPSPAPTLELEDAIERLDVSAEPFVFFVDAEAGRGAVLYRRYDGHYGLLAAA
jgi:hypothetical protein